jgi:hypothetical protein
VKGSGEAFGFALEETILRMKRTISFVLLRMLGAFALRSRPNSDRLYHGLSGLPGLPVMRIQDFMNQYRGRYVAEVGAQPYTLALYLSYEDDGPNDNGYYSHDNGTGSQRLNVGNAWINLTIIHP